MKKSQLRQLIREEIKKSYGSFNDDEHRSKDERSKFLARNSKVNYGFRDYDSDDPRMLGKEEYLSQIQGMSTIEAMIHLVDQGLTEEEALSIVVTLNTDVKDMFSEGYASWFEEFLSKDNNINFWNELSKLRSPFMTKGNILKLAKRYEVNPQDAIRFTKEMYNMGTKLDEGKLITEYSDQEILDLLLKSKASATKNDQPGLSNNLQKHIKALEKKIKLSKTESINEGDSDSMSNLLQTFEKAMTDKATYDKVVDELEGAADWVKPKLMQMADEIIPEKRDGVLELIDDLENDLTTPEDLNAPFNKDVLIQQFKDFIKITDFAIATIKKYAKIDEGTCGYDTDVKSGKKFKTPGGL